MGSKVEAKALLAKAGVPMLPSWTELDQITEFPVLVKASAGGGGRGMRIVRDPAGLAEAIASARREAAAAFGDDTVFGERYVETGRHIEVQVFADSHGTVVALGERECSIQRRHQKIVEEAPSPAVDEALRTRLFAAAETAARAVGYVGAGTVEFLLDPYGEFSFLEMNTRLQVEHPVTECGHRARPGPAAARSGAGAAVVGVGPAGAARARDRGPALRRGPGPGLPPIDRPATRVHYGQ